MYQILYVLWYCPDSWPGQDFIPILSIWANPKVSSKLYSLRRGHLSLFWDCIRAQPPPLPICFLSVRLEQVEPKSLLNKQPTYSSPHQSLLPRGHKLQNWVPDPRRQMLRWNFGVGSPTAQLEQGNADLWDIDSSWHKKCNYLNDDVGWQTDKCELYHRLVPCARHLGTSNYKDSGNGQLLIRLHSEKRIMQG